MGARTPQPLLGNPLPLVWGPYVIGSVSFSLAGLFNMYGAKFAFTSALATLGGTAWCLAGVLALVVLAVLARGIVFGAD